MRHYSEVQGFVKGTTEGGDIGGQQQNPDEIDLGDDDDDDEDEEGGGGGGEIDVEEEAVPEGVFGDVKRAAEGGAEEPAGALDRFKKRRVE